MTDLQALAKDLTKDLHVIVEASVALVWGFAIGFYYCWKLALILLALFIVIAVLTKLSNYSYKATKSDAYESAIQNYMHIQFMNLQDSIIMDEISTSYLDWLIALAYGLLQAVKLLLLWATVLYSGMYLTSIDKSLTMQHVWCCIFAIIFGASSF